MTISPLVVLAPAAFSIALDAVSTAFSHKTGIAIAMVYGPASGNSANSIENRISDAGDFDLVFLPKGLMTKGAEAGRIQPGSVVDVMRSSIGACSRLHDNTRQIDTVAAFTETLSRSSRIAVSAAGSGIYVSQVLLKRLGLKQTLKDRLLIVNSEPVAAAVKRGDADIGFQQIAELLHVDGVAILRPIPEELQGYTVISGGVSNGTTRPLEATDFLGYLSTDAARSALQAGGVKPVASTE